MFGYDKVILGFSPTKREIMKNSDAIPNRSEVKSKIEKLIDKRVELVEIDTLVDNGLIQNLDDVIKVEKHFRQENVDALFIPHCDFGEEAVVAKLGKVMNKPLLVWAPREFEPRTAIGKMTDAQCGLFASTKVLQRYGVPFTYIENSRVDDRVFEDGFRDFIRTASVVKTFRNIRIGQVNMRPLPFLSVMVNESELLEKFGIEIIPILAQDVLEGVQNALEHRRDEVQEISEQIKEESDCTETEEKHINTAAAMEMVMMELAAKKKVNVLASECWTVFISSLGIRPCSVFGRLIDRGLPTACETDINGAVTFALLTAAAMGETPTFFADLTVRHPTNDNAELLWHCGPFPRSLAKEESKPRLLYCAGQWELKGGDVTVARFDGINGKYSLFAGHGRGVEGPESNGTYIWFETNDWPKWERKFIYGPYIHHVVGIHGKFAPVLHEACKYMGDIEPDFVE